MRERSVVLLDGLRVHFNYRVASTRIGSSFKNVVRQVYPDESGDEYRFMAVRHPLDRIVSAWTCFYAPGRLASQPELQQAGFTAGMSFNEFLDLVLVSHEVNRHTCYQTNFKGPHTIDLLIRVDMLVEAWPGLVERFPHCLKPLSKMVNASAHGDWQGYYTRVMRTLAETEFACDMALFEDAKHHEG